MTEGYYRQEDAVRVGRRQEGGKSKAKCPHLSFKAALTLGLTI